MSEGFKLEIINPDKIKDSKNAKANTAAHASCEFCVRNDSIASNII